MFFLRPTQPHDAEGILALLNVVWNSDGDAIAYHGRGRVPGVVALDGERVIGYASLQHGVLHPTHAYLGIHVHPEERRRGVGSALWDEVTANVSASLKAATYADFSDAVRFLERRGLHVSVETHLLTLDLASWSGAEVEGWAGAARKLGYELLPMTSLDGTDIRCDLARLHQEVYTYSHQHDLPAEQSLEDAEADFLGDDLTPAWLWTAWREGKAAGVASVRTTAHPADGNLGWFGVPAAHAADGAALTLALTGLALQTAREDGVQKVTAELDSADSNALQLLWALPWQRGRVWLTLTSAVP